MTVLLEQALAKINQLPVSEQDAIAKMILDELADEASWDAAFAQSQDQLGQLAGKVREDIGAGRISRLGVDEL